MGKKKKSSTENEKSCSSFGDGVVVDASAFVQTQKRIVSVSPNLDIILGGGIPEGSFVTFTGPPKVGKTSLALHFASHFRQKPLEDGSKRHVYFYNIEGRLKTRDLEGITGLDLENFHIVGSTKGNILTGEQYLQIATEMIHKVPNSLHIIDSYSALCTGAEQSTNMDEMQRADGPKLIAKFCRKVCNVIPVNESVLIGITHLMGNPSGMGAALKEKSGYAISYQVDIKLWGRYSEKWCIPTTSDNQVGQKIHWECLSAALTSPGRTTTSYLRYGHGIDAAQELFVLAVDLGFIRQSGKWYKFIFLSENEEDCPNYDGAENSRQALIENNNEKFNLLYNKIKEVCG